MCAFKSAAVMNPDTGVCVLTKYQMQPHPELIGLPNLEISALNVSDMFQHTPLQNWYYELYSKNYHTRTDYSLWHISDALRYVYLYKYGGKYLDSDCLSLRNISHIQNAAASESPGSIANGVLAFTKGHPFIKAILDGFLNNFRVEQWGSVGPLLLSRIDKSGTVDNSTYTILNHTTFYPVHYKDCLMPFTPERLKETRNRTGKSYLLHLWRQIFRWNNNLDLYMKPPNGSFVGEFLRDVCLYT